MARANFSDLLRLLEQDGAAYDEARRKIISNSVRFWDQVVETARTHHDPVVRAKLIGIITNARKIPVSQRRAAIEKLLETESHEIPLRSLRFALRFSLDL